MKDYDDPKKKRRLAMELSMEVRTVKELREFLQRVDTMGMPEDTRIKAVVKIGGNLYKLRANLKEERNDV